MKSRIKDVRKKFKLSQTEFAERIKLTKNYISLIETGDRIPSDRTISDICREFRVNEAWLRTGEGEMFLPKTEQEQVAEFLGSILNDRDDDDFKAVKLTLVKLVSQLPDEALRLAIDFAKDLAESQEKNTN